MVFVRQMPQRSTTLLLGRLCCLPAVRCHRFPGHFGENALPYGRHQCLPYSRNVVHTETAKHQFVFLSCANIYITLYHFFSHYATIGFPARESGKTLAAPGVFGIGNFLRMRVLRRTNLRHILQKMQWIDFFLANDTPKEYTSRGKKTRQ